MFFKRGKLYTTGEMRHLSFICIKQSSVYKQQWNNERGTPNLLFIGICFCQIKQERHSVIQYDIK